jgi:rRNA maturation RNase YbeY
MIWIRDEQRAVRVPERAVRLLAGRLLGRRSLSLAFVSDAVIRRLNRRFLRHDFATDVLAFPLGDGGVLGEVVVSGETARREARARGIAPEEELLRCVAHGILHLLGYDDRAPRDRARMWKRQERELGRVLGGERKPEVGSWKLQGRRSPPRSPPRGD